MLDYKTQSQLVDATAAMLRSYIAATTNTMAASTWHGLALWAEMMGANATAGGRQVAAKAPTLWPSMANWMTAPQPYAWPAWPWAASAKPASMTFAPFTQTWLGPSFSMWTQMPDWGMWGKPSLPMWNGWLEPRALPTTTAKAQPAAKPAAPEPAPYASYRSAGGHATAQVIVPAMMPVAEIAEVTATVVLSPMQTMLGVWRAALGVR
jgi:hypothetical protein